MKSDKLNPCPCCGSDNVHLYQANADKYRTYQVKCRKCGLRISKPTRLEATEAWNRRVVRDINVLINGDVFSNKTTWDIDRGPYNEMGE